jgi:hypothetical protein
MSPLIWWGYSRIRISGEGMRTARNRLCTPEIDLGVDRVIGRQRDLHVARGELHRRLEARGYSPDRVDALVWAFSELLVEPMKGEGIFELYHRYAEAAAQRDKPQPTKTVYAKGSMEWLAEQKKSG